MSMPRLVPICLAAAVLVGCATTEPAPAPPVSSATETPVDAPREAAPAFDGDCSAALSEGEAAAASGAATARFENDWPAALVAGGLFCRWTLDGWAQADLAIFPIDVVPAGIAHAAPDGCQEDDGGPEMICASTLETSTAWIRLSRGSDYGKPLTVPPAGFDATLRLIADRLEAAGAPAAAEAVEGRWRPLDCATFATTIDVASRLGTDYEEGFPGDAREHVAATILAAAGASQVCQWYSFSGNGSAVARLTFLPGAAPFWAELANGFADATPAQIAGADQAMVRTRPATSRTPASEEALVSDGVNVVRIALDGSATDVAELAARVLAARR